MKLKAGILAAALALGTAGVAQASSIYNFEANFTKHGVVDGKGKHLHAGISHRAGYFKKVETTYNANKQTLDFHITMKKWRDGESTEAFTLVLNGGSDPKGQKGDLAMFYFDRSHGGSLSVYEYNGENAQTSHIRDGWGRSPKLIASSKKDDSFIHELTVKDLDHGRKLGFSIDVSGINSYKGGDWLGAMFGDKIGMWLHTFDIRWPGAKYDDHGRLIKWKYDKHGWFDLSKGHTMRMIPTPAALPAGLALMGGLVLRRRR